MENPASYLAFAGPRRLALGSLPEVLSALKQRFDRHPTELVLVFEAETGRQVDFDLRGSLEEILERETRPSPRGPGRPKLGVTSREVSLLPRHWGWLEEQSQGISGALRRLVEHAIKANPGREQARRVREALSRVLSALAGDRPNYEEACRALFRGDTARFFDLVERWPRDIREYAEEQARLAARAEEDSPGPDAGKALVSDLYRLVFTEGDYPSIDRLVAERYTIHSDPGDPWEGQTLDRKTYLERIRYSRKAFPDLRFVLHEMVAAGDRVAVRWSAVGTQEGDLGELPSTLKRRPFGGQTIYELQAGRVAGHWQLVDRPGVP